MTKILISYLNKDNSGSIATITTEIINGLKERYYFIPVYRNRNRIIDNNFPKIIKYILYSCYQYIFWLKKLIFDKPDISHYPITSYLNFYKSLFFLLNAKIFGSKVIGHIHCGEFDKYWASLSKIKKYCFNLILKQLNLVIVTSQYWENYVKKNLSVSKTKVLNNLIDSKFEESFKYFERNYKKTTLFFIGTLGQRKGVFRVLQALSGVENNFKLIIAGSEEDDGALLILKKMLSEYKLENKVLYLGEVNLDKKIELFKECGIFVFPSNNENFPLVVIEAACSGIPIITTKVGALPEFFNDGESVNYIDSNNIEDLRFTILRLQKDFNLRKKLGEQAKVVFLRQLNRKRILKELDNIYQSVLSNS